MLLSMLIAGSTGSVRSVRPGLEACVPGEVRAEGGHSVAVRCAVEGSPLPLRGPARRLFGLPLDPNRADAATLETLPGVGPERARAWIETRTRRPFRRPEDLLRVPGIGPKRSAVLTPLLQFPEPTGSSVPDARRAHAHPSGIGAGSLR